MVKKNYQFNVGKKTKALYEKELRNTKRKINRVRKKYGVDLSNEIELPSLESFSSRKEMNEWIRKVQSFRNRGNLDYQFVKNKYDVVASKKEIFEIKENTRKAQRLADEKIASMQNLPFISGGKQQHTVGMQRPNKSGITRPKDFNFDAVRNKQRLKDIQESTRNKSTKDYYDKRNEVMIENFIDILKLSFHSGADELIEELKKINPDDFYEMYLMFDEFDFSLFDSEGQMLGADEGTIAQMLSYAKAFNNGELDLSLYHENFK